MLSLPKKKFGGGGIGDLLTSVNELFNRNRIYMKINNEGLFFNKNEANTMKTLCSCSLSLFFWNFNVNSYKYMINL